MNLCLRSCSKVQSNIAKLIIGCVISLNIIINDLIWYWGAIIIINCCLSLLMNNANLWYLICSVGWLWNYGRSVTSSRSVCQIGVNIFDCARFSADLNINIFSKTETSKCQAIASKEWWDYTWATRHQIYCDFINRGTCWSCQSKTINFYIHSVGPSWNICKRSGNWSVINCPYNSLKKKSWIKELAFSNKNSWGNATSKPSSCNIDCETIPSWCDSGKNPGWLGNTRYRRTGYWSKFTLG